jgi:hypothetical protein
LFDSGKEREAREYISNNRHVYSIVRSIHTIEDLSHVLKLRPGSSNDHLQAVCQHCEETEQLYLKHILKVAEHQIHARQTISISVAPFPRHVFDKWFGKVAIDTSGILLVKLLDVTSLHLPFLDSIKLHTKPVTTIDISFSESDGALTISTQCAQ